MILFIRKNNNGMETVINELTGESMKADFIMNMGKTKVICSSV